MHSANISDERVRPFYLKVVNVFARLFSQDFGNCDRLALGAAVDYIATAQRLGF